MDFSGSFLIGGERRSAAPYFKGTNPATGEALPEDFSTSGIHDIDAACELAREAFDHMRNIPLETRAEFLEKIADNIMDIGDELLDRAHQETGLPMVRLTGERGRTVGQLRLFASEVRDGAWMNLRIDPAMPDRTPLPRSDLRSIRVGVGPVAVFGASNFPLAFSVAGGDTASAFAAGCPVVVKAHPAHPGTSILIGSAISKAVSDCNLHKGTFSMVSGAEYDIGTALVSHDAITAVGFTGSRAGGLALMRIAANRKTPIPVYAEMSAINPVILLPRALAEKPSELARAYVGSLSLGAGQFCTNPGILLAIESPALETFLTETKQALLNTPAQTMLTPGIHAAYGRGVDQLKKTEGVTLLAEGPEGSTSCAGRASVFTVNADDLAGKPDILNEIFGASSVVIRCSDEDTLLQTISQMEGQLTTSMHLVEADYSLAQKLVPLLEKISGRIIANGWPTGVEVCHAMVHGGPYPATSDGRTTSVGTMAVERFLRPVCFQDFPAELLPCALQNDGPEGVVKRIDGHWSV